MAFFLFSRSSGGYAESDQDLVEKFKNSHNNQYIGELFQRYTHLVYGVCLKYLKNEEDSKDAVMEVFEKVVYELKRHEVSNFRPWLHTLTKNLCLMKMRKTSVESQKQANYVQNEPDFVESDELEHLDIEFKRALQENKLSEALLSLKPEQRVCIELFYYENRSYQEVADNTGFSLMQVKSYIQNGKRNLKNYLDKV